MANNSLFINSLSDEQNKQIWLNCDDYNQLLTVQLQYLRNEITSSPTCSSELKLETSSILQYLINLTEMHQLLTVRSQPCLVTETIKKREFVIAFGPKQFFPKIIQSINDNNRINDERLHLCIYDCFGNIICCSHANDIKDCSINVIEHEHLNSETNCKSWISTKVVGGCTLLNRFLYSLERGLNPILYKFILEKCYYITAVDSQFGQKYFLFSLLDQLFSITTKNNKNGQDNNSLDGEVVEELRFENPAQILSNLYLSSVEPAQNLTLLKKLHINYILNLTGYKYNSNSLRYKPNYPSEITVLHIKISDEMDTQICDYFDEALHFIHKSIDNNNSNRILVHCEAGISRSATIVIAYLMKYYHKSLKSAYNFVKQCKKNIGPNMNFFKQLIQFEKQLNDNSNFGNDLIPSISLEDYLIEQMLEGPAAGFTRNQIIFALEKTKYDTNAAIILLISDM